MNTIDFHTHLGHSIFGYGQTLEELLCQMDKYQIDHAVVCPVQPVDYHLEPENDRVAAAVAQYPELLWGFGRVDPRQGQRAIQEAHRCIETLEMSGLFLNPWEESCPINSPPVIALMQAIAPYRCPVMISGGHVRVSRAWQIADLVRQFPQINFIATSGGQINISGIALGEAETLLVENPNVWLETSGIYREDFIEDLVPKIGHERIIFGSNSPEYHLGLEILRPRKAHLEPFVKRALLCNNALRLLVSKQV